MGVLAVILAAAAGFAVGAVWYGFLGRRWMAAVGLVETERRRSTWARPFLVAALGALVTAGMMRHLFATAGLAGFGAGVVAGFGVGAFLVLPWILTNYAFARRPGDLWWIDGGYAVLACTAIGTVLGLMA